jgi:hypothetical protein
LDQPQRLVQLLLVAALLLTACQSSSAASGGTSASPGTSPSPGTTATPPVTLLSPLPQGGAGGISTIQIASSLAADGSAASPATSFSSASVKKLIAVLGVTDLPVGTKLSYVRYLDNGYVDSKTGSIAKPSKFFYFEFTAKAGKSLTPGHYRLRLYVNEKAVAEVTYAIT